MPKSNGEKFSICDAPHFTDADKAREYLEKQRWADGVICPHCGVVGKAYELHAKEGSTKAGRKGLRKCADCRQQFTVTVGTIFEDSHIPLNKWLMAIHLMCASKKGVSAHQIHRTIGVTYKSAWFMCHRIRYAMTQEPLLSKLEGTVEVDETYVGGKEKGKPGLPGIESKKTAVIGMVERSLVKGKSKVRTQPVERVTLKNVKAVVNEYVDGKAILNTDEAAVYHFIGKEMAEHHTVTHARKQYSYKIEKTGQTVTTNTVVGYLSLIKRAVYGTWHHVSRHHLHRCHCETDFRYNHRELSDRDRSIVALKDIEGKRLFYRADHSSKPNGLLPQKG